MFWKKKPDPISIHNISGNLKTSLSYLYVIGMKTVDHMIFGGMKDENFSSTVTGLTQNKSKNMERVDQTIGGQKMSSLVVVDMPNDGSSGCGREGSGGTVLRHELVREDGG